MDGCKCFDGIGEVCMVTSQMSHSLSPYLLLYWNSLKVRSFTQMPLLSLCVSFDLLRGFGISFEMGAFSLFSLKEKFYCSSLNSFNFFLCKR